MKKLNSIGLSILNSYSQIFFSDAKLLGLILLIVTFFNINAGFAGLIAIIVSNVSACLMGLNKQKIVSGYYGFNSLLVGLGLGIYYNFSLAFLLILLFISLLTFFITVVLEGWLGKYGLPYLSLPFLFGIWTVGLAARSYTGLQISEAGVYLYNDIFQMGGVQVLQTYLAIGKIPIPDSLIIYLQSLGAIFFQYNIYAGLIIAIALLIHSRISFLLTLVGFYSAYYFYHFIGADIGELSYGFIGFNFILTAIAIGGYFIIPSIWSFLWVVLLTPLLALLITGSSAVLATFQLSTFSLPFNIVVITFLYVLKFRERNLLRPELVSVQHSNPEKNLYTHLNYLARFGSRMNIPIHLPFFGEWSINQGHNGDITHKDKWRHAWDFVIIENGKEYQNEGKSVKDFYCYNKPVLAPAEGVVHEIVDGLDDNEIGKMDMDHNWGNTIVIKHSEFLYTQLSHIRKSSFQVEKGDYVKQGDVLAYVGNSGRSPFPHLHFQIQSTPFVGSSTLEYPISRYVQKLKSDYVFKSTTIPEVGDLISNIESKTGLKNAFSFISGQVLEFSLENEDTLFNKEIRWEVLADIYNTTYLYCPRTKSYAYFKVNTDELIFTGFKGDKKSELYYFYLGAYRVIFGFYKNIELIDPLPIEVSRNKLIRPVQDFVAPFYRFMKPMFRMYYEKIEEVFDDSKIILRSEVTDTIGQKSQLLFASTFYIDSKGVENWQMDIKGRIIKYRRTKDED